MGEMNHMSENDYLKLMDQRRAMFIERDALTTEQQKQRLQMLVTRENLYTRRGLIEPQADPPPFDEMGGSPTEDWSPTTLTATRRLKCAWTDRYAVGDWHTTPPNDMYPYANPDQAYVTRVGVTPVGEACDYQGGLASYDEAFIDLTYETLNGDRPDSQNPSPSGATLIEEAIQPTLELISLDNIGSFCWGSASGDPVELSSVPAYRKLQVTYSVTLHGIQSISPNVINYGGYCHSLPYVSRTIGWSFPAETLLYSPPSMTRSVSVLGLTTGWTVAIPWQYQPQTWNKFLNKSKLKPGQDPYEEIWYSNAEQLIIAPPIDLSSMLP